MVLPGHAKQFVLAAHSLEPATAGWFKLRYSSRSTRQHRAALFSGAIRPVPMSNYGTYRMKNLITALIASTFAVGVFAQAAAPAATTPGTLAIATKPAAAAPTAAAKTEHGKKDASAKKTKAKPKAKAKPKTEATQAKPTK